MALIVKNIKDVSQDTRKIVFIYGSPGVGKTTTALSLFDGSTLVVDTEEGTKYIKQPENKEVSIVQLQSWFNSDDEGKEFFSLIQKHDNIIIDTVGGMMEFMVSSPRIMGERYPKGEYLTRAGIPTQLGYGYAKKVFMAFIMAIINSGKNIVFVGHEKTQEIVAKGQPTQTIVKPDILGSSDMAIFKRVEIMCRLVIQKNDDDKDGEAKRFMQLIDDGGVYMTKNRTHLFGKFGQYVPLDDFIAQLNNKVSTTTKIYR